MTLAGAHSSWTALLPGELVVCFGTGLLNPAVAAAAMGSVSEQQSGSRPVSTTLSVREGSPSASPPSAPSSPPRPRSVTDRPEAYVVGMHTALLVGAALATARALASAVLLTGLRNRAPTGELAHDPA